MAAIRRAGRSGGVVMARLDMEGTLARNVEGLTSKTTVVHVNDPNGYDIYIGRAVPRRGLKASKWANPFQIGTHGDRTQVIQLYETFITNSPYWFRRDLEDLKGKRLACWCAPEPCHGDILAELADAS